MMNASLLYSVFIRELQKVYSRLVMTVLHTRMDRYHQPSLPRAKPHTSDIKLSLLECVNKIVDEEKDKPKGLPATSPTTLASALTDAPTPEKLDNINFHEGNNENVSELSRYFKARNNGTELHPGITERLEHSTWEHLYSALRYARKGDKNNARIHVNIASSACKELAHYMPDKQYQGFVREIEQHLAALQNTSQ